ncbi:MAG: Gfo/Idh/MocA family oxidoreductase [Phycisphaerales bacterium]|nr:Gfo/Idh/MocA family oxidoreductase [Phycisphaerales bacterium]NNM25113.1 Gfo/Idh/MocA family oxidoreductase [Phycisphaerales bacterium]
MDTNALSRRQFLSTSAAVGAGIVVVGGSGCASVRGSAAPRGLVRDKLRVLSIGVVGTIGGEDRKQVNAHPRAEIVGLCDVDAGFLAAAAKDHPDAFTCADYREAFDVYGDRFDAVIVATPDHSHCAIMTLALDRWKHVYGQKPLVQQLEELEFLDRATRARPSLVTQTGAQRIQSTARRAAVDILKSGTLGKVIEVHVAFGNGALAGGHYFADGTLGDPIDPPDGFDYDLWLNGAEPEPCRPNLVKRRWRSWWNYGGGQIADWVVHLTDVLFYAFPELQSPTQVCSRTPSRDLSFFHADRVLSTLAYPVRGDRFANTTCNFHFYDTGLKPDRAQLGIGEGEWPGGIFTIVVCEGGTMVLGPSGPLEIWRDGVKTDGLKMPGLPTYEKFNHWHAWVDAALGVETPHLWAPFSQALKCTEAGLLAVKAAKYPGQVLEWDRGRLAFPNHAAATRTLVRRSYRSGFEPVRLRGWI